MHQVMLWISGRLPLSFLHRDTAGPPIRLIAHGSMSLKQLYFISNREEPILVMNPFLELSRRYLNPRLLLRRWQQLDLIH